MGDKQAMIASAGAKLALLEISYQLLTGEPLAAGGDLWNAPNAVVAHGTQDPPLFFYGNAIALELFGMDAAAFIGLPSYKSAEAGGEREERARMFTRLEADNIVHGYKGIRIAADGTRFRIDNAVIWNVFDQSGNRQGQAATFAEWELLAEQVGS